MLMMIHIIFLLEHNYQAQRVKSKYPSLSDEAVFQEARRRNIALIQHITYYEFLPKLLGEELPPYSCYDKNIFPNTDLFFATVSMRYAHTNIPDYIPTYDEDLN
jgi:hypothetical protein